MHFDGDVAGRMMGHDISKITDYLYVSSWPEGGYADEIRARNIRLILSMHWWLPEKELRKPPLKLLWLPTIDSPLIPIPVGFLVHGTRDALETIREGYSVLTHCRYGVHRSVAMACCVLVGMGMDADAAMQLVKAGRAEADPYAPYVQARIRKFEGEWSGKKLS